MRMKLGLRKEVTVMGEDNSRRASRRDLLSSGEGGRLAVGTATTRTRDSLQIWEGI